MYIQIDPECDAIDMRDVHSVTEPIVKYNVCYVRDKLSYSPIVMYNYWVGSELIMIKVTLWLRISLF